jgi:hypothetical protein
MLFHGKRKRNQRARRTTSAMQRGGELGIGIQKAAGRFVCLGGEEKDVNSQKIRVRSVSVL